MGIPVHGNYSKYIWIAGMAMVEMLPEVFQVSALVPQINSLKTNFGLFLF